jgi:hypothetical protein
MCWNQDVSLNTFLFGCFSLVFLYVSNTFSKYNLKDFDNPLMYFLLFQIILVQLTEFFLWRNINHKQVNSFLTLFAFYNITLQPITIILMIPNLLVRHVFLFSIFSFYALVSVTKTSVPNYYTYVGKNNHLNWSWTKYQGYASIIPFLFLLFYIVPLFVLGNNVLSFFILSMLVISLVNYYKSNTFGSMWCWSSNIIFLYFLVDILLIQPFREYNKLC